MLDRRQLLRLAGLGIVALHEPLMARTIAPEDPRPSLDAPPAIRLRRLRLPCGQLEANYAFYRDVFGWPTEMQGPDRFVVHAGATDLEFERAPAGSPFFHFAFNISRNKFDLAKAWLAERTEIVHAPDGRDQFHFTSRDADAVYFLDPAGNLGELIAHSRLDNTRPGSFGLADVHEACEIGVVTPDVRSTVSWLSQEFATHPYRDPTDDFSAVGDERGFFIVVRADRLWFPRRRRPAVDFSTGVWIEGEQQRVVGIPGTSVEVRSGCCGRGGLL